MLVVDADRDQCHGVSTMQAMLGAAQGVRRRDAERVQQSPAERPRAVVEVVHQDLQFDGEVDVVHGRAERAR